MPNAVITTTVANGTDSAVDFISSIGTTGDLTITGPAVVHISSSPNRTGRTIIKNGWVRAAYDTAFGVVPATYQLKAIILDGGTLQNGVQGYTDISATRGIYITENNGQIQAGYNYSAFTINAPVAGKGALYIGCEVKPVILAHPANAYEGGTYIGGRMIGASGLSANLCLGADEVLPDGDNAGDLHLLANTEGNAFGRGILNMLGHTETVNALHGGENSFIRNRYPDDANVPCAEGQGKLILAGNGDSEYGGHIFDKVILEKNGTGKLTFYNGTPAHPVKFSVHGDIVANEGEVVIMESTMANGEGRLILNGAKVTVNPSFNNEGNFTMTGAIVVQGEHNTIYVNDEDGEFILGAAVTTTDEDPSQSFLRVVTKSGKGITVSSKDLRIPVKCEGGIRYAGEINFGFDPGEFTVTDGTTVTLNYPGALDKDIELTNYHLVIPSEGLGNGTITVNSDAVLYLYTRTFNADGTFTDSPNDQRTYANNVILNGGKLVYRGEGYIKHTGTITGQGKVVKEFGGTAELGNGTALAKGSVIDVYMGTLKVKDAAHIGNAKVITSGNDAVLSTMPNGSLDFTTGTMAFPTGMLLIDGKDALMVLHTDNLLSNDKCSKKGEGVLRIEGTKDYSQTIFVREGVMELATESGAALSKVGGVEAGATLRLLGANQYPLGTGNGMLVVDGGTVEVEGTKSVPILSSTERGGKVLPKGEFPAVLEVTGVHTNLRFSASLEDGESSLTLKMNAANSTLNLQGDILKNPLGGLQMEKGEMAFTAIGDMSARFFRFSVLKTRPNAANSGSGTQMSEFSLYKDGVRLDWPAGMKASSVGGGYYSSNEAPVKMVDNDKTTKCFLNNVNAVFVFEAPSEIVANGYGYRTANDSNGRDPVSWTLEISNDGEKWELVDTQNDVSITGNRQQEIPAIPVAYKSAVFASGYPLVVNDDGVLMLKNALQTFDSLQGNGYLNLLDGSEVWLAADSAFAGNVTGSGVCNVLSTTGSAAGVAPTEAQAVVKNGTADPLTLTFADGNSHVVEGLFMDSEAPLALTLSNNSELFMAGQNQQYTGAMTLTDGAQVNLGNAQSARYLQFKVTKNSAGNEVNLPVQMSEVELMLGGSKVAWPAGTTVSLNSGTYSANEHPSKLIDGDYTTKNFTNGADVEQPILTFDMGKPVMFDAYAWYTANDMWQVRNPASWVISISNDGVNWAEIDRQNDIATPKKSGILAFTGSVVSFNADNDALSDVAPIALSAGTKLQLSNVSETFGTLSGAGEVSIINATATILMNGDATFSGSVTGAGTLVVAGTGILDLTGATLNGVTNLVLAGSATVKGTCSTTNDICVTGAGGVWAAQLTTSKQLALDGALVFAKSNPDFTRCTPFAFQTLSDGSATVARAATFYPALTVSEQRSLNVSTSAITYSTGPAGSMIIIR